MKRGNAGVQCGTQSGLKRPNRLRFLVNLDGWGVFRSQEAVAIQLEAIAIRNTEKRKGNKRKKGLVLLITLEAIDVRSAPGVKGQNMVNHRVTAERQLQKESGLSYLVVLRWKPRSVRHLSRLP